MISKNRTVRVFPQQHLKGQIYVKNNFKVLTLHYYNILFSAVKYWFEFYLTDEWERDGSGLRLTGGRLSVIRPDRKKNSEGCSLFWNTLNADLAVMGFNNTLDD